MAKPEGVASHSPGLPSAATLGQRKNRIQPRKGLRPTAQGCRPRLPWDNARIESNPERGCVPQPRVAVRGYPGTTQESNPTPKGVASHSPGLPSAATLGQRKNRIQPRRGCVPQPRVAVRGYPGTTQESNPTPKGLQKMCRPSVGFDAFCNPVGVVSSLIIHPG